MSRNMSAHSVYLTIEGAGSLFFSMIFVASQIYQVSTVGLNPLQLVLVGTTLEFTAFVCEVPTGIVADVYSRRLSVIIGYLMMGVGFVLEGVVPRFEAILLAQVLWGLGYTFTSGATEAWIADEIGEQRAGQAYLRAAQVGQIGSVVGSLAGIGLGSVQINLPIVAGGALVSLIGVWLMLVMPEHGFKPKPREQRSTWGHMTQTLRDGIGMVRLRPALSTVLVIGAVYGAFSEGYDRLWTAHLLQNFTFPDVGDLQPIGWLGGIRIVGMLLSAVAIEAIRRRVDTNHHQSLARAMAVIYALLALAVIAIGLAGDFVVVVPILILAAVVRRTGDPLYTAWVNQRLDPQVRATVISMSSQANALGQIAGGPIVGAIGTFWSLRAAFVSVGLLLTPVLALIRHTSENHES